MKIRIVATQEEFEQILPVLMANKDRFDSWKKPQKGNDPKYADNPQLLQYLEIEPKEFLKLISHKSEPEFLTTSEVAQRLGVSVQTVLKMIKTGELSARQSEGIKPRYYVSLASLEGLKKHPMGRKRA